MKADNKTLKLSLSSVFAAIIFLATMIHISAGANGSYIHIGDAFIYLAASILPLPYAVASAVVGSCLADIASSAVIWALPTAIIKSLTVILFTSKSNMILCKRNIFATVPSLFINCTLYYVAQILLFSCSPAVPLASLPFNIIQSAASAVVFISFSVILDRSSIKQKLFK